MRNEVKNIRAVILGRGGGFMPSLTGRRVMRLSSALFTGQINVRVRCTSSTIDAPFAKNSIVCCVP